MALARRIGSSMRDWRRRSAKLKELGSGNSDTPGQASYFDGGFGKLLANRPRRKQAGIVVKRVGHGETRGRDAEDPPPVPR